MTKNLEKIRQKYIEKPVRSGVELKGGGAVLSQRKYSLFLYGYTGEVRDIFADCN